MDKKTGINYILINTDSPSNKTKSGVIGTIAEEQSHIIGKIEGRQKQVPDGSEKGLESLGRPANDYVKDKLGDNSSDIQLSTDGIDLTNANVGEKVGDVITPQDREERTRLQKENPIGKYIQIDFDRAVNGMVGLAGSVFRGRASYGLIKSGAGLLLVPEPTPATKIAGGVLIVGGVVAGIFTISDAVESGQNVYYGATNQRDKKSINFGREFLGEDSYDTLDMLSVAGMPILYQYGDYTRVIAEGEAAQRAIIYNPNLTYDENKFLNDYMNKEIPGEITSKYEDVKTYRYNATTNPGPLAEGKNPPINNFYGGMYNDASDEGGIFIRVGNEKNSYGNWYTRVSKNSEAQARMDLAIKKWWVDSNGEIKIRGYESDKSILNTVYYIKLPEGIPKYKGPVGYQGGPFLGGLDQEQYFIPNSWKYGEIIETYPVKY